MQQALDFVRRLFCDTAAATGAQHEPAMSDAEHHLATPRLSHQLHFASLLDPGRALSFPCNRCGEVQLDGLSEHARNNYFFARNARQNYGAPIVIVLENRSKAR